MRRAGQAPYRRRPVNSALGLAFNMARSHKWSIVSSQVPAIARFGHAPEQPSSSHAAVPATNELAAPGIWEQALRAGQRLLQIQPPPGLSWLALRASVLRRAVSSAIAPPSEGLTCLGNAVQAALNVAAATPPASALKQAYVASALHVIAP